MRSEQEIQEAVKQLAAVSRMKGCLFPDELSEREFGHSMGYIEALKWVLEIETTEDWAQIHISDVTTSPETEEVCRRG